MRAVIRAAWGIGWVTSASGAAQVAARRIDGATPCQTCRLVVTPTVSLSVPVRDTAFGSVKVMSGPRGGFFVIAPFQKTVDIFDAEGRLVREWAIDAPPAAQFTGVNWIVVGPGDSLFVFESKRYHVFDADLRYGRSVGVPLNGYGGIPFANGVLTWHSITSFVGAGRMPIHVIGPSGNEVNAFGALDDDNPSRCLTCGERRVGRAAEADRIWMIDPGSYAITQWSMDGRLLDRLAIERSSWFSPSNSADVWLTGKTPRPPFLGTAAADASGLLWIEGGTARTPWRPVEMTSPFKRLLAFTDSVSDTVFDVVDPRTGQLLVSHREPGAWQLVTPGVAWRVVETKNGRLVAQLYRLNVEGR